MAFLGQGFTSVVSDTLTSGEEKIPTAVAFQCRGARKGCGGAFPPHPLSPSALAVSVREGTGTGEGALWFAFWGRGGRGTSNVCIHKAAVGVRRQRTRGAGGGGDDKKV